MSCPWVSNHDNKISEKTMKYAPLRWELKQRHPRYESNQCNIILDVLLGWSKKLDVILQKLVASKAKGVLKKMQKACLSGTLNIARTFNSVKKDNLIHIYTTGFDRFYINDVSFWL